MNYDYLRSGLGKLDLAQRAELSKMSKELGTACAANDQIEIPRLAAAISEYVYEIRDSGIISSEERGAIAEWFSRENRTHEDISHIVG